MSHIIMVAAGREELYKALTLVSSQKDCRETGVLKYLNLILKTHIFWLTMTGPPSCGPSLALEHCAFTSIENW